VTDVTIEPGAWADAEPGTEALLDRWLVEDGATVQEGQPIAEVVLVKATLEIVAPAAGRLVHRVKQGDTLAQGVPIAAIA
jgi:pyruvate dehydrogenase E2 component (dihydrolipoamide acetyltransferase)